MTGFGCVERQRGDFKVTCEIKSINHRYLDVTIKGAPDAATEDSVRRLISSRLVRGRLDVTIEIEWLNASSKQVKVDKALALAYYNNLRELQEYLGTPGQIQISDVSQLPGVLVASDREVLGEAGLVLEAVGACVDRLVEMREREGQTIARDLEGCLEKIERCLDGIEEYAPQLVERYRNRIAGRIRELCGAELDQDRLAQEVAILAERSSISEELSRLRSHVRQMRSCISDENKPGAVGKKLDFILQEMQREANTAGSKAGDTMIGPLVVEMKCEIEKMREQIQNVE